MNRLQRAALAWQNAGLANDFVFSKVMTDPDICRTVIQDTLPELTIKRISPPKTQQEINLNNDAKGIRFDVYTTDEYNNHYDIEMQVTDRHNLPQRVRYYQSLNALAAYDKGENYHYASSSYVIFVCCFDPFKLGAQYYSVNKHLNQFPRILVHDGATDVYLNTTSTRQDVKPALQSFLDEIAGRNNGQGNKFRVKLRQKIIEVKHSKKWRADFMRMSLMEMDHQYELEQARKSGFNKARLQLVNGLLEQGKSEDEIVNFLVSVMELSRQQAQNYYHQATHQH